MNFTPAQLDAIDISRRFEDACVVAGPGSGKTTVLVEYFRRLVEAGVDPLRILAITFTEKAAGNMRAKLAEAFRESSVRGRLERAWVSTVHGFCSRLLKENAIFAGVDPEFYVADERESWRLQQEAMAAAMEEVFQAHPLAVRALIRGLKAYDFEEAVLSAYDAMRGAGIGVEGLARISPPADITRAEIARTLRAIAEEPLSTWSYAQKQYLDSVREGAERVLSAAAPLAGLRAIEDFECNLQKCKRNNRAYELAKELKKLVPDARYALITEYYAPQRRLLLEILERFDRLYRDRKRQAGSLDFADLEEFAVRLLDGHPETRARVQAQFEHVLMDEFQDTNGQQARLLALVRPPGRFYAVGDINQSIFGFRHAEPGEFETYRKQVARARGHLVELTDNFRSRPEILSAVETVLEGARGIEPRSLVAGRKFDAARPVPVDVIVAVGEESHEPNYVARRIAELVNDGSGFEYKDIALLVRNTEVLGEFTAAFDDAAIPYLVNRGKGFYETREVNDLTHLLRVIANPRDEISLATVLRSPLVEVSDEALLHLKATGENIGSAMMRLDAVHALAPDDLRKLRQFRDRLNEWRLAREYVSFDQLLLAAIDDCGYPAAPNIEKFLAQVRAAAARQSLDDFIAELALVRDSNPREPDAPPEDSANAVKVMTVHSAKGLEFPVVFLAALHKGIDTKLPVVAFSREHGLGARWRNPAGSGDKDDLFQHAIRAERAEREHQEANRLLFVAMTRAEHHLVLSFSSNRKKPENWASVVAGRLGIDPQAARDEVVAYTAPDGKQWRARVLITDRAPEPVARAAAATSEATVEFLDPPRISGQHDTNATVTALTQFAMCPRQYYLGRYLGFEGRARKALEAEVDPADEHLSAGEFGTLVHKLLAAKEAVANPDPQAVRLASVFQQSALGRRAAKAARIEREFDFLMAVEEIVVRGQVDLWFEEGGELVIVDYKTDSVTAAEAHQRTQDYAMQLRLYALAVERVAGRPPDRAWLHFLRPNTAIPVDLTPSLLDSPEQTVREFLDAQEKQDFPLREGEQCRRCQFFKDMCPSAYPGEADAFACQPTSPLDFSAPSPAASRSAAVDPAAD